MWRWYLLQSLITFAVFAYFIHYHTLHPKIFINPYIPGLLSWGLCYAVTKLLVWWLYRRPNRWPKT